MKDPITTILQDGHASLHSKDESARIIASDIAAACGRIFGSKAYVAILDSAGSYYYVDHPHFDEFLFFIRQTVIDNNDLMEVGDYSMPFGGTNLIIFKVSEKAFVALYTPKGKAGQLLAFRPIMQDWASKLDDLIGEVEKPIKKEETKVDTKKTDLKRVPLLIKPLTGKEKFSLEEASVIQYCDGTYSLEEICEALSYPMIKVNLVIRKFQKKKMVKVMRIL